MRTITRRRGLIALSVVAGAGLIAFLAVQAAIARNGPAVLDAVDRMTAGSRNTQLLAKAQFGSAPAQKLAVYGPSQAADHARPVIIFSHGGSWRSGDPDDYGFFARGLVPEGFIVVLAGYRLGETGKFPAMVEDTASAVAWTRANIARYGGDPDALFLVGHSAGAYNVVMTALDRQWLSAQEVPDDAIAGVVALAGPFDFYPFESDAARVSFGSADDPANSTQPIHFARPDAPPMLLMTGDADKVVQPRNTVALTERLQAAGAPVEQRIVAGYDHYDILTHVASPWRGDDTVIAAIRDFALPIAARRTNKAAPSVPVQSKLR